ncbi:MAG: formylglycine-generating enzyme family protein [Chthoniobacterales bacterium]|nr:formylglycine-generating enzyme family protein [Chthoniobacterales bacterium]
MNQHSFFLKIALVVCLLSHPLFAQENSSATANKITIDLVPVGDPNNTKDIPLAPGKISFGSVATSYQIGKYDVTAEQYCAFLNAVASKSDPHRLYNENMSNDPDVACITRSGDETTGYSYQPISDYCAQLPITYVNIFSTFRFCNWLENGQPVGEETVGTTESGAYNRNVQGVFELVTNSKWNIPTENQWYKAAYYQPAKNGNFPYYYSFGTASFAPPANSLLTPDAPNEANYCLNGVFTTATQPRLTPVGTFINSASPCGAYDMAGNVNQWTTAAIVSDPTKFVVRGGSWASKNYQDLRFSHVSFVDANTSSSTTGFRVVYNVPAKQPAPKSSWWWPWSN